MEIEMTEADRVLRLLRKQRELYERLADLSQRQRSLITGDHPEQLLTILRDRQSLVNGLAQIHEQLAPLRSDWEQMFERLAPAAKQEVSDLLKQINGMLRGIIESDQQDGALLAARRNAVGQAVGRIGEARAANTAYGRLGGMGESSGGADLRG